MPVPQVGVGQRYPFERRLQHRFGNGGKRGQLGEFALQLDELIRQPLRKRGLFFLRGGGFRPAPSLKTGHVPALFRLEKPFGDRLAAAAFRQKGFVQLPVLAFHQGVRHFVQALPVSRRQIPELVQRRRQLVKLEPLLREALRLLEGQLAADVVELNRNGDRLRRGSRACLRCGVRHMPGLFGGSRCCGGCALVRLRLLRGMLCMHAVRRRRPVRLILWYGVGLLHRCVFFHVFILLSPMVRAIA